MTAEVTREGFVISPHRQEYAAEFYDENAIVPLQLYLARRTSDPRNCQHRSQTHTCAAELSDRVPGGNINVLTSWVRPSQDGNTNSSANGLIPDLI